MTLHGEVDTMRGLSLDWTCLVNVSVSLIAHIELDVTVVSCPDVVS
jgi:hypothetical protein